MLFTRYAGGLLAECTWRGGVGIVAGRLEEAALGRGDGSEERREEEGEVGRWCCEANGLVGGVVGAGGVDGEDEVGGWEERERRRWVVEEEVSRMIFALREKVSWWWGRGGGGGEATYWASVRFMVSVMSSWRTSVGEPLG